MTAVNKIIWSVILLVLAAVAISSQFIPVRLVGFTQTKHTANTGELTGDALVGQTFVATRDNLSSVDVLFATYSGRDNTEVVEFHLRRSIEDTQDLRSAMVLASELGDNQLHEFTFDAIEASAGEEFFFYIVSPTSVTGNAITVDLNTQDPYHQGSAFLVRGNSGDNLLNPIRLSRSGKQTVDVVFGVSYTVVLREAVLVNSRNTYQAFIGSWAERQGSYMLWAYAFGPALFFFLVLWIFHQRTYLWLISRVGKTNLTGLLLVLLVAIGFLLRLRYASELPLTNDEGNYLYDAASLRRGILAGGDGYVKAPLVILWITVWQFFLGATVLAGRMSSVVIGSLTAIPLYFLARELWSSKAITKAWVPSFLKAGTTGTRKNLEDAGWGRRIGIMAAAIWSLFGAGIVFNIYVHTQPVALFLGVSGLAVLLMALRGTTPHLTFVTSRKAPSAEMWFTLAGVLLGMGVASRKSILALGLLPILFILLEGKTWKLRGKHFLTVGIGFLVVIAIFLGVAYWSYGTEGVLEAAGFNSAENGIATDPDVTPDQLRAYSIRGMTPFFRESLPLILLALIGLGVALERFIAVLYDRFFVPKLAWIFPWLGFAWAWNFFFEYEGAAFIDRFGIRFLWYVFALVLLLMTIVPGGKTRKSIAKAKEVVRPNLVIPASLQPGQETGHKQSEDIKLHDDEHLSVWRHIVAVLAVPLWLLGLILFYTNWIKFHANYISEFIPPLVILAAYGVVGLFHLLRGRLFVAKDYPFVEVARRILMVGVTVALLWSIVVSNYITFLFEHTGTFQQSSVREAAAWAIENIPSDETIFTGAAAIPYLSGHRTALDIAHPRWYAYGFTRNDPERLNTFLPPAEEMVQAFRDTNWVLLERQTGFSFLMEYTEIERGLERDFESVIGIENGSNTLTFYRRVR